ncbi:MULTISPECIES: insulinase family protein [unclassified Streptomyces]|uniref:insulinase family protein n=1 Tax=unclassified Streptomyces TaxID=2593676 RepID=UPI0038245FFD
MTAMTLPPDPCQGTTVNDLTVRLTPLPGAHSVGACLTVRCGSRDDAPEPAGTAHLVEHLRVAAGPAAHRAAIPVFAQTDIAATHFQAVSSPEATADLVRRLLSVLDDGNAAPAPGLLEAERQAVLMETRRMDLNPLLRAGPLFASAACGEPGMDAIARTTPDTVAAVTAAHLTTLVGRAYRPANAVLSVAGPPSALARVADTVNTRLAATAAKPAPDPPVSCGPPLRVPGLDGLIALTLVRPRHSEDPDADALPADPGPFVQAGHEAGVPILGRTTLRNAAHLVDVVCWRPGERAGALLDALRAVCAAPRYGLTDSMVEQTRRALRQERAFTGATPLGRAFAVAEHGPAVDAGVPGLGVWQVAEGRAVTALGTGFS